MRLPMEDGRRPKCAKGMERGLALTRPVAARGTQLVTVVIPFRLSSARPRASKWCSGHDGGFGRAATVARGKISPKNFLKQRTN